MQGGPVQGGHVQMPVWPVWGQGQGQQVRPGWSQFRTRRMKLLGWRQGQGAPEDPEAKDPGQQGNPSSGQGVLGTGQGEGETVQGTAGAGQKAQEKLQGVARKGKEQGLKGSRQGNDINIFCGNIYG